MCAVAWSSRHTYICRVIDTHGHALSLAIGFIHINFEHHKFVSKLILINICIRFFTRMVLLTFSFRSSPCDHDHDRYRSIDRCNFKREFEFISINACMCMLKFASISLLIASSNQIIQIKGSFSLSWARIYVYFDSTSFAYAVSTVCSYQNMYN